MSYTNNDFVTKFDQTKDLPEEVMLPLMKCFGITCYDIEIFEFLVKWHTYQTNDLKMSLHLTPQLFQCIRYSLIIPQLLSSKVATCDLSDKQLLSEAYLYLYNSSSPLGVYGENDCQPPTEQSSRKPLPVTRIQWNYSSSSGTSFTPNGADKYNVNVNFNANCLAVGTFVVKSMSLANGIYSLSLSDLYFARSGGNPYCTTQLDHKGQISIAIADGNLQYLNTYPVVYANLLITMYIHDDDVFMKFIDNETAIVKSTITITGTCPFSIHICNSMKQILTNYSYTSTFSISHSN